MNNILSRQLNETITFQTTTIRVGGTIDRIMYNVSDLIKIFNFDQVRVLKTPRENKCGSVELGFEKDDGAFVDEIGLIELIKDAPLKQEFLKFLLGDARKILFSKHVAAATEKAQQIENKIRQNVQDVFMNMEPKQTQVVVIATTENDATINKFKIRGGYDVTSVNVPGEYLCEVVYCGDFKKLLCMIDTQISMWRTSIPDQYHLKFDDIRSVLFYSAIRAAEDIALRRTLVDKHIRNTAEDAVPPTAMLF